MKTEVVASDDSALWAIRFFPREAVNSSLIKERVAGDGFFHFLDFMFRVWAFVITRFPTQK